MGFFFQSSIKELISRDSFCAPENTIFNAVVKWTEHNQGQDPSPILECVRLPLMSMNDLLNVVRPTSLVSPDSILDAIKLQTESRDMELNYRGSLSKFTKYKKSFFVVLRFDWAEQHYYYVWFLYPSIYMLGHKVFMSILLPFVFCLSITLCFNYR